MRRRPRCLERRGKDWPSREFLEYAKQQSEPFPALVRWVQERLDCWAAVKHSLDLGLDVLAAVGDDADQWT